MNTWSQEEGLVAQECLPQTADSRRLRALTAPAEEQDTEGLMWNSGMVAQENVNVCRARTGA